MIRTLSFILLVVLLSGCSEYSKLLKKGEPEEKYAKAIEYYEDDQCYKALPLFDELIGFYRGTEKAEKVYYYYAHVHYCIGDFYLANYYFKNFVKTFPNSTYAEECLFLAAMCSYKLSPRYPLDQSDTRSAIDEMQLFIDQYPQSELKDSCNNIIRELNVKLERKAYEIAKLYVKTERYKAGIESLKRTLDDYPTSPYREEMMYMLVKCHYLYAENSIDSKKSERYKATSESYFNFVRSFPESAWRKESEGYHLKSLKYLDKSNS